MLQISLNIYFTSINIITSNTITAFFNNLDEINLFLKSLGFKEVIEKPFDLVEFLKKNLVPKEVLVALENKTK